MNALREVRAVFTQQLKPPGAGRDVTFFVFSAPHYGYNDNLDNLNLVNIQAMNGMPGSPFPNDLGIIDVPRGVLITGDLTEAGRQSEFEQFVADYGLTGTEGLINFPVYEERGNHDFDFEVEPVANGIINRHGGLTYSFDWDDVHIACCDLKVDDTVRPWLEKDLAAVGPYKPVVIYTHFSPTLDNRWVVSLDEYEELIKKYNVVGTFHNHNSPEHLVWRGFDEYIISAPFRGLPGFAVVHLTDNQMVVANYVMTYETPAYIWTGGYWSYSHVKEISPPPTTLTISKVNELWGDVRFDPAPWDPNRPEFPAGTEVKLTAKPIERKEFANWEIYDPNHPGDANYAVIDANDSTTVTVDVDREVTVVFMDHHELAVDIQGLGVVTLDPAGGLYEPNTLVTMTATPTNGWRFVEWLGDLTGSANPESMSMDADKAVTAVFAEDKDEYTLTIQTTGQGTVDPNSGAYALGTPVQLTATPAEGWVFTEWSGDVLDANRTDNPLTLDMNRDRTVTASFVAQPLQTYVLTTQTDGHGIAMPSSGPYTAGAGVNVYAKATPGWEFDKWEGDVPVGKEVQNPLSLVMDQDRNVTGCFKDPSLEDPAATPCSLAPMGLMLALLGSAAVVVSRRRGHRGAASCGHTMSDG